MSSIAETEIDYVLDHPCFGCKHAMLLPVKEWTLTRRLGCKNASKRRLRLLKPLANGLSRYCEAEEHQFPDFLDYAREYLGFMMEKLNGAYSLIIEEKEKGHCVCPWDAFIGVECKEEDEEAKESLRKEWHETLAEISEVKTRSVEGNG